MVVAATLWGSVKLNLSAFWCSPCLCWWQVGAFLLAGWDPISLHIRRAACLLSRLGFAFLAFNIPGTLRSDGVRARPLSYRPEPARCDDLSCSLRSAHSTLRDRGRRNRPPRIRPYFMAGLSRLRRLLRASVRHTTPHETPLNPRS